MNDCKKKISIGTGPDEEMFVRCFGGPCSAGVDDDEFSTTLANAFKAFSNIWRGEKAAVGNQGIGSEDQQVPAAVDIGNRHAESVSKHQPYCKLLGNLVDRTGGEDIACPQGTSQHGRIKSKGRVVYDRISQIQADGIFAVL